MAKLRSLQLTRMVLRISECRHREGVRYGGKYETLFSAPRQSETISTLPFNVVWILFMLRSNRWIAMSPRSSPRYAFATSRHSKNDPTIRPPPLHTQGRRLLSTNWDIFAYIRAVRHGHKRTVPDGEMDPFRSSWHGHVFPQPRIAPQFEDLEECCWGLGTGKPLTLWI